MEPHYHIVTENGTYCFTPFEIVNVQVAGEAHERQVRDLTVGERLAVTRNEQVQVETILLIGKGEQDVIRAAVSRIVTLEENLLAANEALLNIQKSIVSLTAEHVQRLFQDQVLLDSIAHRILAAGANAIAHKAQSAKNRAPELVVIESPIPGAIRVTLTDDAVVIEEQTKDGQWVGGDQMSAEFQNPEIQTVFGNLVVAYGGALNRPYYVVESGHLEEFRKEASSKAMDVLDAVESVGDEEVAQ